MKNKKIRMYSILSAFLLLVVFVVGFNFTKASAETDEISILDKVIEILKLTNQESAPVVEEPVVGLSNQNGEFVVTKTIDYDDIVTTGVAVTNPATGDFYIDNVIIETGTLTIASGTQIQIVTSGDTYGTSTVLFATDVNAFPKATTMDLNTAIGSVVGGYSGYASSTQRVILEDSAQLLIKCTGADCKRTTSGAESGTGYLRVTTILKKVNSYSNIYE